MSRHPSLLRGLPFRKVRKCENASVKNETSDQPQAARSMMRTAFLCLVVVWALVLPAAALAAATPPPPARGAKAPTPSSATRPAVEKVEPWDTYRVLAQRNIFVKDRSRLSAPPRRSSYGPRPVYASPAAGDPAWILTGIGQGAEDGQAFVEDPTTGTTVRTWAGQPLSGGQVVSVTLDGIEYEQKGVTRQIKVGQDLTGATPAPLVPLTPPAGAGLANAGPGGRPPGAGGPGPTGQPVVFGGPGATTMPAGGPGAGTGGTMISMAGGPGAAATQPATAGGPPPDPDRGPGRGQGPDRGPDRGPAAAQPAPPAAGGPADDAASRAILERMRQRRLQETR
jgi:hypothetical protein